MEENFASMLEESLQRDDSFEIGDRVRGTVVLIDQENIFVDIAGKSEATIEKSEFFDDQGNISIEVGDTLEAYIVNINRGEVNLTSKIGSGHANPQLLYLAYQNQIPVTGTVQAITSGGYIIMVSQIRCFCPFSQLDLRASDNPETYLEQRFSFRIIQYEDRGRNIVLSRRILLEEERDKAQAKIKQLLRIDDVVNVTVNSIQNFGLFVDLMGMQALIPKSEISYSKSVDLNQFKKGDTLEAMVISLDWSNNKIALSMKKLLAQPWDNIGSYKLDQTISGRIMNIIPTGAFLELEPGLEGFIPISKMNALKRIQRPQDMVSIGQSVQAKIIGIDPASKRISLELVTDQIDPWLDRDGQWQQKAQTGFVENSKEQGVQLRLENGMLGFIPRSQLVNSKDIQKAYSSGKQLQVAVTEINYDERRLILSEKEAIKWTQQKTFADYQETNQNASASSLGAMFKTQFAQLKKDLEQ